MKAILVVDIPEDYTGSVISVNLYGRNNKLIHEIHTNKLRPIPNEACERLVEGLDAMEKMKSVEVRVVRRTE